MVLLIRCAFWLLSADKGGWKVEGSRWGRREREGEGEGEGDIDFRGD